MLPLEFALTLSEGGFHLLPLKKYTTGQDLHCKQALRKNWPTSQKPTEEDIAGWDDRNYGVLCGRDDLIVIDADSRESSLWVDQNLPPTPIKVKSLRGYHFYYRSHTPIRDKKSLNPGLPMDIKGSGYVVGPGCMRVDEIGQPFVGYQLTTQEKPTVEALPYLDEDDLLALSAACEQSIGGDYLDILGTTPFQCIAKTPPTLYDYPFQAVKGERYEACRGILRFAVRVDELSFEKTSERLQSWDEKNEESWGKQNLDYQLRWYWKKNKAFINRPEYGERHREKPIPIIKTQPSKKFDVPDLCKTIPGVLQTYLDHYLETAPVPHLDMGIFSAIGFGSAVASRRFRTSTGAYSSMFLCSVAGTGCGKNHSQTLTKKILNEAGCEHLVGPSGYRSAGGLLSTLKDLPNHISFIDEFGDEISGLKGRRNPVALALWASLRSIYSSAGDIFSPASYSREGKSGKAVDDYERIHQPGVTLFGLTTQSQLLNALSSAEVENGTINRFVFNVNQAARIKPTMSQLTGGAQKEIPDSLIEWTRDTGGRREGGQTLEEDHEGNKVLRDVNPSSLPISPFVVPYSNEARAMIDAAPDLDAGEAMFARYMENAHRLMLILAVSSDSKNPIVTTKHVRWSLTYLRHLYEHFAHVFGTEHANTEHEANLIFAYSALRRESDCGRGKEGGAHGLSKSRWQRRLKRFSPRDQEMLILQLLRDGTVVFGKEPTRSKKGRFYLASNVSKTFLEESIISSAA